MYNSRNLKRITIATLLGWCLVILAAISWSLWGEYQQHILIEPKNKARQSFNRNTALRLWFASHGGIYVPVTGATPANPYLSHVPERDIQTPSGKQLTLMNPAYAIRHFSDNAGKFEAAWHLTSLKPINPDNAPDEWEKAALQAFEQGAEEVIAYEDFDGKPHLRLIRPLRYEQRCQKCHGHLGYELGDVRGGVGAYLDMEASWRDFRNIIKILLTSYLGIFFTGVVTIGFLYRIQKKSIIEQEKLEAEEKQANELLRKREAQLVESQKVAKLGSWDLDLASQKLECSDEIFNMFDKDRETYTPSFEKFTQCVHQDDIELMQTTFNNALESDDVLCHAILQIVNDSGRQWVMEAYGKIRRDADGKATSIFGTAQDITEKKEVESELLAHRDRLEELVDIRTNELKKTHEQLLHAEKLSAIGGLSASIAHELNNPLQGVMTVIRGVQKRAALNEEDAELVDMAVIECERMKDLIKSLQDFNRPTSGRVAPMNIHDAIETILLLIKKESKEKGITLETFYAEDLPQIMAVSDQIKQVLLNLSNNAIYACGEGDRIIVEAQMIGQDEIAIKMRDTGSGIRPEDINHIFEPFFTTKPEVKGTGLGLSISYGIIKKHGGRIEVESEVNKGTTFIVTLPVEGVKDA